ncbi:MAG: hypothetical protein CMJ78_17440 [Planctomycetaceae bacterium]|nr:hypothetical protein [Planctomycetaceae bacterium]
MIRKSPQHAQLIKVLAVTAVAWISTANLNTSVAEEAKARKVDVSVQEALHRQKGDQLKVYVNANGLYINGKSLKTQQVLDAVRESGLSNVILSAESYVLPAKLDQLGTQIRKAGAKEVTRATVKKRDYKAEKEAKMRLLVSRQKNDQLKVYLNGRAAYINGKTVSADEIARLIKESQLKNAEVRFESYVAQDRVAEIEDAIKKAGIETVTKTSIKRDPKQERESKLLQILHRQRSDQIKIHVKKKAIYINGKSVGTKDVTEIIERSGLEQVIITTGPFFNADTVKDVEAAIRKVGVNDIQKSASKKVAPDNDAKLREILFRQKGDELKVYVSSRGLHVNGKSISTADIAKIVKLSGLESAAITTAADVTPAHVDAVKATILKAGVKNVTTPTSNDENSDN